MSKIFSLRLSSTDELLIKFIRDNLFVDPTCLNDSNIIRSSLRYYAYVLAFKNHRMQEYRKITSDDRPYINFFNSRFSKS